MHVTIESTDTVEFGHHVSYYRGVADLGGRPLSVFPLITGAWMRTPARAMRKLVEVLPDVNLLLLVEARRTVPADALLPTVVEPPVPLPPPVREEA